MGMSAWGGQAWIVMGLIGMVLMAVLGAVLSGRRIGAIAASLPVDDVPIPAPLRRQLEDPVLVLSAWLRTALALGIVFVMSTKPGVAASLMAVGLSLVAGLAVAVAARSRGRGTLAVESRLTES